MRDSRRPSRWLAAPLAAILAACQQGAAPSAQPLPGNTAAAAPRTATVPPTSKPTAAPEPTRLRPTTDLPQGYRRGPSGPFGITLAVDGILLSGSIDDLTVVRRDARTLEELGQLQVGKRTDFPPNLQSMFAGSDGVWVTLAFDHAVVLLDPATGKLIRKITVKGFPYDVFESDGELWIADFERSEITRYDLEADKPLAIVRTERPTDVVVVDGAAWAPAHLGRTLPHEPITRGGHVARIDLTSLEVDVSAKVGPRPYYLAAGFGGVWTGTATGGTVERVDTSTGEVTAIQIGEDGAFDVEVIGDSVWATVGWQWPANRGCDPRTSYFVRIDPASRQIRELVAYPCPAGITPAEGGFWVSGIEGDEPVSTYFEAIR